MLSDVRVLGIDASLACTGWAIVNERGDCIRSGVIRPKMVKSSARVRACEIAYRLAHMLPELAPTHGFIEEPLMYRMASISIALAILNGAISMGVAVQTRDQVQLVDVNVSECRKAVEFTPPKLPRKDKDRAKKLKAALMAHAQKRWPGVEFATADAAEAALIALRGLMHVEGLHPIVVKPRRKPRKKKLAA